MIPSHPEVLSQGLSDSLPIRKFSIDYDTKTRLSRRFVRNKLAKHTPRDDENQTVHLQNIQMYPK